MILFRQILYATLSLSLSAYNFVKPYAVVTQM